MIRFGGKLSGEQDYQSEKSKISEAISIAAHQLRHPISVIKSYLEALGSEDFGKLNPKQAEYIEDALENVRRITEPVNNLLKNRQVVENLIANAVKYKKTGQGIVEVSLTKKGKEIIFSCKDNGISIPKEDFKKIFTKFYRSEEAMEIDPTGAGLGLYLNRATVEASGGKVWFVRNKDFGTLFFFSLPIFSASLFITKSAY